MRSFHSSGQKNTPPFMVPYGSLPYPQEPATDTHPGKGKAILVTGREGL
jgi:hypothetical protein